MRCYGPKRIRYLPLNTCWKLQEFAAFLPWLTRLEQLCVRDSKLTHVPPAIAEMTSLRVSAKLRIASSDSSL